MTRTEVAITRRRVDLPRTLVWVIVTAQTHTRRNESNKCKDFEPTHDIGSP